MDWVNGEFSWQVDASCVGALIAAHEEVRMVTVVAVTVVAVTVVAVWVRYMGPV